jgi:hypothetical protein
MGGKAQMKSTGAFRSSFLLTWCASACRENDLSPDLEVSETPLVKSKNISDDCFASRGLTSGAKSS